MTQEQIAKFEKALPIKNTLDANQQTIVAELHAEIFKHKMHRPCTTCPTSKRLWFQWADELGKLYADAMEAEERRMRAIVQNGNNGEHYEQ